MMMLQRSNGLYRASLLLLGYFPRCVAMYAYAMPTNDTDYNCQIKPQNLFDQSYRVYITPHHTTSYY